MRVMKRKNHEELLIQRLNEAWIAIANCESVASYLDVEKEIFDFPAVRNRLDSIREKLEEEFNSSTPTYGVGWPE
jgi:hypothetical protein